MKRISLLLFAAVMLLLSVSCASTPKKTTDKTVPSNEQSRNELPPAAPEIQPSAADSTVAEPVTEEDTVQSGNDTDYSDLAEAVPADETNAAPAEEQQSDKTDTATNKIAEPLVHDEPYVEIKQDSQPQGTETARSGSDTSADRKKAAENTETTPVKTLAEKQTQPAASKKTSSGPVSSTVPAKTVSAVVNKAAAVQPETPAQVETTESPVDKAVPSRSVTIDKNQYLDVTYPGTGWIYLGESDGSKNMIFFGRKLGETDTSFTLRSRDAGKSLLHFYKNDVLTGKYIDDYLEVNVTDTVSSSQEHAAAPSYADIVPPRPASAVAQEAAGTNTQQTESAGKNDNPADLAAGQEEPQKNGAAVTAASQEQDSPIKTVIQTTESAPNASSPAAGTSVSAGSRQTAQKPLLSPDTANENADDLLREAQTAYDAKQYEKSQELLTFFFDKAVSRIDEGLYLQGEVLEAKSPIQNIKGAIDSYGILMKNWPESTLWKNAQQRSIYLKRMYIDIR